MGFKKFVNTTIKRCDLFSATPAFRYDGEPAFQTLPGGLISIVILLAFYYFLYLQMSSMLQKLEITFTKGVEDNISSASAITSFPVGLAIEGVDLSTTPRNFMFELLQHKLTRASNGSRIWTQSLIPLSPCTSADWAGYGDSFYSQMSAFGMNQMLCIPSSYSISLAGYYGSDSYEYLSFKIMQCNQTKDSSCDTTANINTYMSNYLTTRNYFKVQFYVVDTIITPTNQSAITYMLEKDIFLAFSDTVGTVGYIKMGEYSLETDTSYFPFSSYDIQTGSYIDIYQSNAVSLSTNQYVSYNVYRSTKALKVSRTIGKIDEVLSYVGGLFSLIFVVLAFFFASYSQYRYELYIAEAILDQKDGSKNSHDGNDGMGSDGDLNQKGNKSENDDSIKEQDFNFLTYFLYSIYDWLDVFGVSPSCTCCNRYKRIHETRDDVCEQMDPAKFMKRFKVLETEWKFYKHYNKLSEQFPEQFRQPDSKDTSGANRMEMSTIRYGKDDAGLLFDDRGANVKSRADSSFQNEMIMIKPGRRRTKISQSGEDKEKMFLGNLLYEAIDKLDRDQSELGKNIKANLAERMKKWGELDKKKQKQPKKSYLTGINSIDLGDLEE